jgi:class 3 adenylate cyclase
MGGIIASLISSAAFGLLTHPENPETGLLAALREHLAEAAATSPLVFAAAWSAAAIPCTRSRILMFAGFMLQIPLTHQAVGVLGKHFSPTLLALSIGIAGALPEVLRFIQQRRNLPPFSAAVHEPTTAALLAPAASESDLPTSPSIAHEPAAACAVEDARQEEPAVTEDFQSPDPAAPELAPELSFSEPSATAQEAQQTAATETANAPAVTEVTVAHIIETPTVAVQSLVTEAHANEAGSEEAGAVIEKEHKLEAAAPAPRRAVCTVLHCELTNHALLVNSMHPGEFTTLLNQVINAFEEMVSSRGGVCDRLSGDSLRAFFETPPTDPTKGQNALHCALALKNRFGAISQACELKSGIDLDLRIGVNTGEAVIARFGSGERHFDGVAGESAEWGGRLASANLLYGSRILIGASSHLLAGDGFETRPIDLLQREMPPEPPEAVFELLAASGALSMDARERLNLYCEGVMLFRERRWKEAAAALHAAKPKRSNDDAIDLLLHRISEQETLAEFTV